MVVLNLVEECLRVVGGVVLDNLGRVAVVDGLDVLSELGSRFRLNLLQCCEPTVRHKLALRANVRRQDLRELPAHVLQNVLRRLVVQQRLQGRQVHALLDDALQGALRLRLQIVRALTVQIDVEQLWQDVAVCNGLGVVRAVPPNLAKRPRGGGLDVILGLLLQSMPEWRDALRDHNGERERLRERADVPESHHARQPRVPARLVHVVHQRSDTTRVHDQLRELRRVLRHLADARRRVLAHHLVHVLQQRKDLREDLPLHYKLRQLDRVLRDLCKALAHLTLQLAVAVRDQRRQVANRALVHHSLRKLGRVLGDVGQRRRGDALQRQLRLLHAQHQRRDRALVHHLLCEVAVVPRNVPQRPRRRLLHARIELLQAAHKRLHRLAVHYRLCQLRRVARNAAQHKRRGLLVKAVLVAQRVHQLSEDVARHNVLRQLLVVVR
mmetsp:Transcript_6500/g.7312  ORF Transcript_6500/g.7312 Transcript_6500/m.7312 type:complete len:439 (+) Transcript_6500:322-1638(+)